MPIFAPDSVTRIESGAPMAMHKVIGQRAEGRHFRADMRAYSWQTDVVSSGWSASPQVVAFFGQHQPRARSAYRRNGQFTFEPSPLGDIILLPPEQTLVSICPAWDQRAVLFNLDADILPEFSQIDWTPERLRQTLDIRNGTIRSIMSGVAREIMQPGFASNILFEGASMMMLAEFYRMFGPDQARNRESRAGLSERQLDLVSERVRSAGPAPSLQDLADLCGISRRNFSRRFKNATGLTAGQFIAETQIDQAKALLSGRQLLIKEVAHRCGFSNVPAFSAAFRRMTSFSPAEYRRIVHEMSARE